jgi:hypothetical protein
MKNIRLGFVSMLLLANSVYASDRANATGDESEPDQRDEILVWGRAADLIGAADWSKSSPA